MGIKLLSLEGESDQPETFRDFWRPNDKIVESLRFFFMNNYLRVIKVFYDPPFYMTCYAIRGGGLTNLELLGIAGDKITG